MANNIITAAYSSSNITYTKPAYQYDYGMILKFSGIELPQAYEVHFSNTEFCGESISQIGDETGVTIPDEMFLSGSPIYAWMFLHTGEDDGETVYKAVIGVNKRAKPSNLEPTPVQQDAITQAVAALNVAVEQTAADVVAAGESAEAAAGSAEAAGQAKDDAVEAKGKAEEAQEGAETAQGKAEGAQQAAEAAAGSVLGLTADATVDANVGTPSVEVEVTTESDHKNMSFTFRNLKGVQGDPGVPGVGISSVVLNSDYTLTITLTNGTSYTTSSIRGEVGATPNLTIGTVSTLPEGSQATATITGTDENPVLNLGIPVGDTGDPGVSPTITVTEITGGHKVSITDAEGTQTFDVLDGEITEDALEERLIDKADVITSTASGEIVTIQDGGDDMPVVDLIVSLLPVQSGSGDPSPDNIRPISGWTGVEVTHVDNDYFRGVTIEQGTITANGNTQASDYRVRFANRMTLQKGTYKIYADPTLYGTIRVYNVGGSYIESESTTAWTLLDGAEFTLVAERDVKLSMTSDTSQNVPIVPSDVKSVMACKVKTIMPFDWSGSAGTVYGCTLHPDTGALDVDWVKYKFTKEDSYSGWAKSAGETTQSGGWITVYHDIPTAYQATPNLGDEYGRFSWGVWGSSYLAGENRAYVYSSKVRICIVFSNSGGLDISNLATCKSWIEGICGDDYSKYPEVVFKLATPTTYQLSENQIATYLGNNSFWSNGNGQIDLEYRADTKLYIQQLTKPSEDDMVANQNITSGSFFMVNNRLFLASVAIAQGATIVPGTNCTEISLADALNSLNS